MAKRPESAAESPAPPTQRAYTLRLRRSPGACSVCGRDDCTCWHDALWATHEAANKGAKVFGEWLLTLRGGLSHELAKPPPPPKGKSRSTEETAVLRKNRRILLALSWLSVEDERGAPNDGAFRVVAGRDTVCVRHDKVLAALRSILADRGVGNKEIESWLADCAESLSARIREDAVWVNRSAVFDAKARDLKGLKREYARNMILLSFFGPEEDYFELPDTGGDQVAAPGGTADEGPEFRTLARQWASTNFGTGKKSDTAQIIAALRRLAKADFGQFARRSKDRLIAAISKKVSGKTPDFDGLRIAVGWKTGRSSKGRLAIDNLPDRLTKTAIETMQKKFQEEADEKESSKGLREVPEWMAALRCSIESSCGMPFKIGEERDHIGEFAVMLDHAARRVSIGHSWIKRAEAERRRFEADAQRLSNVPPDAATWLDAYVQDRSGSAGGEYRIRRRAIEAWDGVLKRWSRADCKTADDRIAAAREVQADPEIEKFGDIQLFEALAEEDAVCVWRPDGQVNPSPLRDYVLGHDARFRQRMFKVPAYRHPDPLRHPVFCDFGNSRWDIRFAVHEREKSRRNGKQVSARFRDERALRMGLWTGQGVQAVPMRWACKRLVADLGLRVLGTNDATEVTRGDRLGRAAAGATGSTAVLNVFDEKDWNGRLQAPRAELDRVARLEDRGKLHQAKALKQRLRWLVSFSPRLRPTGPFIDYAARKGLTPNRKGEYYPNADINKADQREGHSKLVLSRLPGLRVLSVDLGHRFAAACSVWDTLPVSAIKKKIKDHEIIAGGISRGDLYCHTLHIDERGKKRTTIYRRIGPDRLPDGSDHPAPWARLDRQFFIKLQGEERLARAASQVELEFVRSLESDLGWTRDEHSPLPRRVDELMAEAVRSLRLGLARHARRAKIANALDPTTRSVPGMGGSETAFTPGDDNHVKLLTNALFDWHALATERRWADTQARELWNRHIAPLPGAWRIEPPQPASEEVDNRPRQQRRKDDEALREQLKPIAQSIAQSLALSARAEMYEAWRDRWFGDDGAPANRDARSTATGWHTRLRQVTDWITGRRYPGEQTPSNGWKQNVGGLSLTRIATMRSLYQLHKTFAMRARPDKPRGAPEKGESNAGVAQSLLDAMERMREQRVKQLASRIVEAALGVGRMNPAKGRDRKRPQSRVDEPCHAVVIESLRHYRPDELRTRRENKALMTWSAGKVRKYLEEACQLHGLHLREVMPNYTSRQCSRTGRPGLRCGDVPIDEFLTAPWWNKTVNAAEKRITDSGTDSLDRLLVALRDKWSNASDQEKCRQRTLRLPRPGGDLFVSAPPRSCRADDHQCCLQCDARRAVQADLNAAANIGLRALFDPDFPGRWWYVPCIEDRAAGTAFPRADKVKGSACFGSDPAKPEQFGSLIKQSSAQVQVDNPRRRTRGNARRTGPDAKDTTNFWSDPSAAALRNAAAGGFWLPTPAYWRWVRKRVVASLWTLSGLAAGPPDLAPDGQPG